MDKNFVSRSKSSNQFVDIGAVGYETNLAGVTHIARLENANRRVTKEAERLILAGTPSTFDSSRNMGVVILRTSWYAGKPTSQYYVDAQKLQSCVSPPIELACCLREALSDDDMRQLGFDWLAVLHSSVSSDQIDRILTLDSYTLGSWLRLCDYSWHRTWALNGGLVFAYPIYRMPTRWRFGVW